MKNIQNKRSQAGFTLMEILVVMVIIGILVSIGIGGLVSSQRKGRDAKRKEDLHQLATSLEVYYHDKGNYPDSNAFGQIVACTDGAQVCSWGTIFYDSQATYMVQLPNDPVEGYQYYYNSPDGSYYELYARLENEKDKDLQLNASEDVMTFDDTLCADGSAIECNYGVSSTNRQLPDPTDP